MVTEIRSPANDHEQMVLGQVRRVFEPDWIHSLDRSLKIEFYDEPACGEELENFMSMHGYDLKRTEDGQWFAYFFE